MPRSEIADRNLLFGMLAVQLEFVSRDQLFEAMKAWMFDKVKPLGQILVERSALDSDTRSMLDALVGKHIARHGEDPRKSLIAASRRDSYEELSRLGDPDLESSLATITPTIHEEGDPHRTHSRAAWSEGPVGGRYRVLRPHARGGLGAVFVAHDSELNREVALKEILEQHAYDPANRSRFQLEAEINGGLEHPGIVPVYGLGCHGDGRPYYVMRFIRGDTLKEAIQEFHRADRERDPGSREIAFRQLLRRFLDICFAVDYAHSRGVLHRDLKPSNVMVGKYGETLVVDWGLAKIVGRPDDLVAGADAEGTLAPNSSGSGSETQPGAALGTPSFMSPEQAAGDLGRLGPSSDVYSLGATLYAILTGRPPLEGTDVGEILRRVQKGDFPTPRHVNSLIPSALEAICLKAMALDSGGRYPSARALAEDVERWLADEPVLCRREPRLDRWARWSRRHKSLLAGAAGAVLVAIIASFGGVIAFQRARALQIQRAQFEVDLKLAESALSEIAEKIDLVESYVMNARDLGRPLASSQAMGDEVPPAPTAQPPVSSETRVVGSPEVQDAPIGRPGSSKAGGFLPSAVAPSKFMPLAVPPGVAMSTETPSAVPPGSTVPTAQAPMAPAKPMPAMPAAQAPSLAESMLKTIRDIKLLTIKYEEKINSRRERFARMPGFAPGLGGFAGSGGAPGIIGD